MGNKWYGKIGYDTEGIIDYIETENKAEADAYVKGFELAQVQTACEEDDCLESYWTVVDQLEPVDE